MYQFLNNFNQATGRLNAVLDEMRRKRATLLAGRDYKPTVFKCTCPRCVVEIPAGSVNVEEEQATCPECKETFSLDRVVKSLHAKDFPAPPAGSKIAFRQYGSDMIVTIPRSRMSFKGAFAVLGITLVCAPYILVTFGLAIYFYLKFINRIRNAWREEQSAVFSPLYLHLKKDRPYAPVEHKILYTKICKAVVADLHPYHIARIATSSLDPLEDYETALDERQPVTTPIIEIPQMFIHFGERLKREEMVWLVDLVKEVVSTKTEPLSQEWPGGDLAY